MLTWMRTKFGPVLIGLIIGFIAFVFVFYGVFNPKSTRGLHEGSVAGIVNGESVTLAEFNRELSRRMEFFKNLAGGKISEEQLKSFNIREGVFNELVNRKLLAQAAVKMGMVASDEEVRDRIREMPVFQANGKFDPVTYQRVLEANRHTPASFERLVRDDLSMQQWGTYFKSRTRVSDEEVRKEFLISKDKRNIKYVLLTTETGKKAVSVPAADVAKFLADSAKLNLARSQYEQRKDRDFKGLSFDVAKEQIARDILAGEKTEEIRKINEKLADQVVGLLGADSASDKKINSLLKTYGVEVKQTGKISRSNPYLPGIGEARELMADAFAAKPAIDLKQGGKAKKYNSAAWWLVAAVVETEKPDLAQLDSEKDQVMKQISFKKERELFSTWMKDQLAHAKIEKNKAVLAEDSEAAE